MRRIVIAVLIAAGLWSGWWLVGSTAVTRGVTAWFDARAADGWEARHGRIRTRGFPNRFDTTIDAIVLADPATGLRWEAPFAQILALSYTPHRVVVALPPEQTVAFRGQTTVVRSDRFRASAAVGGGLSPVLDRATAVATGLTLTTDDGAPVHVAEARLAMRPAVAQPAAYRIGASLDGVAPPEEIRAAMDPDGVTGAAPASGRLDATVTFDAPLDAAALETDAPPRPVRVEVADLSVDWGPVALSVAGALDIGPDGIPEGRLDVTVTAWRDMLGMMRAAGAVPPEAAPALEGALSLLARMSGGEDLALPLAFRGGFVTLGPVPLGRAPRIVLP